MKLLIFDIETTGLDKINDQIIQFASIIIDTNTNKIIDSYSEYIQPVGNYSISLNAYFKHQITPDFLKDKPHLKDVAEKIISKFNEVNDILTYNGNAFDIPFLKNELNKYGYDIDFTKKNCYDSFLEEKRRNSNSLTDTYKRYKGKTMDEAGLTAHDALSDVKATYTVFYAQQKIKNYGPEHLYGEDGVIRDMMFLEQIQPCFSIGKYNGISLNYVSKYDQTYLKWCISDNCKFLKSTKNFIKQYVKN